MKQTIYKGMHFTLNRSFPFSKTYSKTFMLASNCWYENSTGWNKVGGLTSFRVHRESVRVAWRPASDYNKFHLAFYEYHKGERKITGLFTVNAFERFDVIIQGGYISINGIAKETKAKNLRFVSEFYFGGKDKAPQKMNLIKENLKSY